MITLACVVLQVPPALAGSDLRARIDKLARIVQTDSSFKLRALAARRLGAIASTGGRRDPTVVRALVVCLEDRNEVVRAVCAQSLGEHGDPGSQSALVRASRTDDSKLVRSAALKATSKIEAASVRLVATRRTRRLTVKLGRIEVGVPRAEGNDLLQRIRTAIEDRIEPHRPAVMPRENPDLRIDVVVQRLPTSAGPNIGFEARALLVELPGSNLRHASQATATTKNQRKSRRKMAALEERVALEAVNRAVDDVLVSLLGNNG